MQPHSTSTSTSLPAFDDYHHLESVTLKEDSIRTLERIRDNCTNLATLETSLRFRTIMAMESAIDALDNPGAASEALALVDARFKAISSLKEIIVNVYDEPLSCDLREKMRGCGWTIEGTWEESERGAREPLHRIAHKTLGGVF
jgi:hypothetical protein